MLLRLSALLCLGLASASIGHAGPYVKVTGLYTQPSDISVNNTSAFRASLKNNVAIAGAVGYKLALFRVEAELQHAKNKSEADESSGTLFAGSGRTFGSLKQTSGFANGYFDVPAFFGIAPYIGAGLGYARFDVSDLGRSNNNVPFARFSGRDSVFGYQAMAGLQLHLIGPATLNAGFRLVRHEDIDVRNVVANARESLSFGTNRVFELGVAIGL